MTDIIEMDLDSALSQLMDAEYEVPEKALRWLSENWTKTGPILIDYLRQFNSGRNRSDLNVETLIFTTLLMAERRDVDAFVPLCDLGMQKHTLLDEVMGWDWVTESFPRLITSTFSGDVSQLYNLIENHKNDEFVRGGILEVLGYLTVKGRIEREETRQYLSALVDTLKPRNESYVWTAWAIVIGRLGFEDCREIVKGIFDRGFIGPQDMDYSDFEDDLTKASMPEGPEVWENKTLSPISDTVSELSTWYAFSKKRMEDEQKKSIQKLLGENVRAPFKEKKVGRNELCPCGSGKKYKKCCL